MTTNSVHPSAAEGYQRNSTLYASIRPSYHPDLLKRFALHVAPTQAVVEMGAGTGIFTSQLVAAGYRPTAVEPVAEMRARLTEQLPEVNTQAGTAEQSGLASNSVDAVVAAQAFHWFNHPVALAEIKRILHLNGLLICVWNIRDESVHWVHELENILGRYAGDAPRHRTLLWRKAIESDTSWQLIDEWETPNPQPSSREGVMGRALSTSFIAALDATEQQKIVQQIETLITPLGDRFDFPYRSQIQVWRLAGE